MRGSEISQAKLHLLIEVLNGIRDGSLLKKSGGGDPFDLTRENNSGKWTKRLLLQREAESHRFCERLAKEVRSAHETWRHLNGSEIAEKLAPDILEKMSAFNRGQRSVRSYRALDSAQARDTIDRWFAMLKEEARRLKKTDADFQDVDMLARTLKPVIKALDEYEKLAEPSLHDDHPLRELANFVIDVSHVSRLMGPMTKNSKKMALVRAKRSSKSQDRYRRADEEAKALRERKPNLSPRSMAHRLAPKYGLERGTLEKHFGKVFPRKRRVSRPMLAKK